MKIGEAKLTPAQKGKLVVAWKTAQIAAGVKLSAEASAAKEEADLKRDVEKMEIIREQAKARVTPSQAATTCDSLPQLGGSQAGEVKLEETIDQTVTGSIKSNDAWRG